MLIHIIALLAGLIFGLGLIVSGMVNPDKVQDFLDMSGSWDPSLLFVMGGAIAVGLLAFTLAKRRNETFLGAPINMPTSRVIDKRLVLGSLAFGIGWGLAGICPGPGIVLVGSGNAQGMVFVAAMLVGMGIFELLERHKQKQP